MTKDDRRCYEMLARVRQFGAEHGGLFPGNTLGGRMFAALGAAVDDASGYFTSEAQGSGAARSGALSKAAARAALREALATMAATARAIAADVRGVKGTFLLPNGLNDLELAATARAFGLEARPFKSQFIAHGLPATFLADLQTDLQAFEQAAQQRVTARAGNAAARAGIRTALDAALDALARLDAIVPNILHAHHTILAGWKLARHLQRTGPAAAGQPVSTSPEPVAPVTPPAQARPEA